MFSFLYGFIFLTLIITSHIEESIYIISSFIQSPWNDTQMIHFGKWVYELTSIGLFVLILIYFIFLKNDRTKLIYFALQSSILLGIVYFLPFYIGFAFYFGLWHSLLSFDLIFSHLRVKRDFFGIQEVFFKLLPFNILALGGIILFVWLHNSVQMKSIIGHTFIGLSLITLPHVQVFSRSLNKKWEGLKCQFLIINRSKTFIIFRMVIQYRLVNVWFVRHKPMYFNVLRVSRSISISYLNDNWIVKMPL